MPEAKEFAESLVKDVVAELGEAANSVSVTVDAVSGTPAQVLLDAAAAATELVVGHRGRGGFAVPCWDRWACPVCCTHRTR